jgi:hypothetical protein
VNEWPPIDSDLRQPTAHTHDATTTEGTATADGAYVRPVMSDSSVGSVPVSFAPDVSDRERSSSLPEHNRHNHGNPIFTHATLVRDSARIVRKSLKDGERRRDGAGDAAVLHRQPAAARYGNARNRA